MEISKIANRLTYASCLLLLFVLVWHWCGIGFMIFSFAILGGFFTYLSGLYWDYVKTDRAKWENFMRENGKTNDNISLKLMQRLRITTTICIISLFGIFSSPRIDCHNNGPQEAEAEPASVIDTIN